MTLRFPTWKLIQAAARRWWFLALLLLPQFIPPFTSKGYDLRNWGMVNATILTHPIKSISASFYPVFQVIPLVLVLAVLFTGRRVSRIFSGYVALSYAMIAFLQSISISEKYGFSVCTANLITFLVLAGLWAWEAVSPKNIFEPQKRPWWKYWVFLPALLAFWEPVNPRSLLPDFNPAYLLTSGAGLSFCMVTPLYLALLTLYFPRVNQVVLAGTALIGLCMGLGNMLLEFVIYPNLWWVGVLHFPLLILSLYGLWLSFKDIALQVRNLSIQGDVGYHA